MTEKLDLSQQYDERAGAAILGLYNLAASGGGHAGGPVTDAYRDLLDLIDVEFRAGMESGDVEKIVTAWNKMGEVTGHIAHAHTRLGTVLLATVVNNLNFTPEEAIQGAISESRSQAQDAPALRDGHGGRALAELDASGSRRASPARTRTRRPARRAWMAESGPTLSAPYGSTGLP